MKPHFLQSTEWEEFQKSEGYETFREKTENYEFMAILKPTSLGNYLFVPYGPTLKAKKDLKNAISAIKKLAETKKCIFIRFEPTIPFSVAEMRKIGAKKVDHHDPEHTWVLDLSPSEDEINKEIEKNKTRAYRNAAKKGITVRKSKDPKDMKIFFKFYETVAEKDNFQTNERKYLTDQLKHDFATLYITEFQDPEDEKSEKIPIAATINYDGDDTSYYAYAGADYEHRKKLAGAITVLQMIYDAKAAGKKYFDFWGITTSEDPSDPWYGFTKFKQSFGGYQVDYAGTYDIAIDNKKYALYTLLRPINKFKRKIIRKK
jgi:lipid II:glycine glycyltransferase (peptidoglycan interpeptide bridge formation enzyme)